MRGGGGGAGGGFRLRRSVALAPAQTKPPYAKTMLCQWERKCTGGMNAHMWEIILRGLSLLMLRAMKTSTARPVASQAQAMRS